MSDYQAFCESFGGSANDPDFMDNWLSEHCLDYLTSPARSLALINEPEYEAILVKYKLSVSEASQLKEYLAIYAGHGFKKQADANKYITDNNLWDNFKDIRSMNDHGPHVNIPGILPKIYKVTCEVLKLAGLGAPLTKATKY